MPSLLHNTLNLYILNLPPPTTITDFNPLIKNLHQPTKMSNPRNSSSSSDAASIMSSSTAKSTTSLLKKVFRRDSSAKPPMTDAQAAEAQRERENKANYMTAAATYASLR